MMRVLLALACVASACARNIELLPNRDGALNDGGSMSEMSATCSGIGTPTRIESVGVEQCTGVLAAAAHRYALCTCSSLQVGQTINSQAFDSTGLTTGEDVTAAIGINGDLASTAKIALGGALYVAGAGGAVMSGQLEASESLHMAGPFSTTASEATIKTDAYVGGNISGKMEIKGTLHVPAAAMVDPAVTAMSTLREPVSVAEPCDCSPQFADVSKAVAALAVLNDNSVIGLSPTKLKGITMPIAVDLPCGRFFLSGIDTMADVALSVHGRAVVAIMGDATIGGGFTVTLDAGAELDLLVTGNLSVNGGGIFGNKNAPSRVRIWASSATVLLANAPIIGAVIHAPSATVSAPRGFELYGSLLSRSLIFGGGLNVHYDRAILSGGVVCGAPAEAAVH